jgi:flagellar biosynthesis/type III secretory pathway chaperone
MNLAESIKSILSEQVAGYRMLLEILQRERECLVHIDPAGVETLSKEKDTIVLKLRLLEEERIRLVQAFARNLGVDERSALEKLAEVTGDGDFQRLRLQLISLLQGIMELNDFNRVLIERSSAVIKNALNFLGSLGINLQGNSRGALLSREV